MYSDVFGEKKVSGGCGCVRGLFFLFERKKYSSHLHLQYRHHPPRLQCPFHHRLILRHHLHLLSSLLIRTSPSTASSPSAFSCARFRSGVISSTRSTRPRCAPSSHCVARAADLGEPFAAPWQHIERERVASVEEGEPDRAVRTTRASVRNERGGIWS